MDNIRFYSRGEVPDGILDKVQEEASRSMGDFTVALWSGKRAIGSGTLVKANGRFAVLTAHHVTECWRPDEPLGLNIADFDHSFSIHPSAIGHHVVGAFSNHRPGSEGPDLALLEIRSVAKVTEIAARKSFLNLERDLGSDLGTVPPESKVWFVVGSPGEWTSEIPSPAPQRVCFDQTLLRAQAVYRGKSVRNGFDFLEVEVG